MSKRTNLGAVAVCVSLLASAGCSDRDRQTDPGEQNRDPVIDSVMVSVPVVCSADTVEVFCIANDPDADSLAYTWTAPAGTILGSGPVVRWIVPPGDGGHDIEVEVEDGRGGSATAAASVDVIEGTLLLQTGDGLLAVNPCGGSFFLNNEGGSVEVLGTRIFQMSYRSIAELGHDGSELQRISISDPVVHGHDFAMLPSGGFVYASNGSDSVFFMAPDGTYTDGVPMPNGSVETSQNIDGIVVDDRLILSESGNNDLLAFELDTHAASIFRSFPEWGGWLGAIEYHDGLYYLCGGTVIRKFTEAGEPVDVATLDAGNITGIVVVGSYAYVVVNFEGTLHRVDLRTGADAVLLTDLAYPQDIEYLPVRLEEPPGK